jgi:hypothetical protein
MQKHEGPRDPDNNNRPKRTTSWWLMLVIFGLLGLIAGNLFNADSEPQERGGQSQSELRTAHVAAHGNASARVYGTGVARTLAGGYRTLVNSIR